MPTDRRLLALVIVTVAAVAVVSALPPVAQDPNYHRFADQRPFLGLPHGMNVLSNLAFVLAGVLGLAALRRADATARHTWPYYGVFAGAILIGIGSGYYHWAPDHDRLVWDRLPMTLVFMSLLAGVIGTRIDPRAGRITLVPLLILGAASVGYWDYTERQGYGDLRLYGFVQFYGIFAIVYIGRYFPSRAPQAPGLRPVFVYYVIALLLGETFDDDIYALGQIVSGHTLKHLLAAMAIYSIVGVSQEPSSRSE
jgi:hypothetical protein